MRATTIFALLCLTTLGCEPSTPVDDLGQLARPLERPIGDVQRNTTFECAADMGGEMEVWRASDGSAFVVLEAAGGACNYHAVFVEGSERHRLSDSPGGYLLTVVARRPGPASDVVVCMTNIEHHSTGGVQHAIDSVALDCAHRLGGAWTNLVPMVSPTEWAPWPRELRLDADDTITLSYTHDFSYQFMNLNDRGRPPEDGVYELHYDLVGGAAISTTQVSGQVRDEADEEDWEPSAEEIAEFDDGIQRRFHNEELPEDVDRDGEVDAADVDAVLMLIGLDEFQIDVVRYAPDVDADGDIDDDDAARVRDAL